MKRFFPLLFFILFLFILTGANIYLANRLNWYFGIEKKEILNLVFPALTVIMIFGMIPFSNSTKRLGHFIYIFSAITMGLLLYLLLSVLITELIRIFTGLSPKTAGIAALILTLFITGFGMLNSWNLRVSQKEIALKGLTKEIRAMHISDVHIGHFRGKKFLQNIANKTNSRNVDIAFITGDLFDGRIRLSKKVLEPLTQIKVPVYFIEGNHDRYTGIKTIKSLLRELQVNVLENEISNWKDLQIVGLNHMRADDETYNMHAAGNSSTIKSTLEKLEVNKNKPTILLHHSPDGIRYASKHGVNLYLAGHTHAGQLFPVTHITKLIFDYNKGLHHFNGTQIFVSQGAGTFGPPMRIGTKSEITLLTLKPG